MRTGGRTFPPRTRYQITSTDDGRCATQTLTLKLTVPRLAGSDLPDDAQETPSGSDKVKSASHGKPHDVLLVLRCPLHRQAASDELSQVVEV